MHHDTELQRLAVEVGTDKQGGLFGKLGARLRKWRWFALFVLVPTLIASIYYGFIAADVYVSESRFVVKAPDKRASSMGSFSSFMQSAGLGGGQEQSSEILGYLRSRDALQDVSRTIDVREIYSAEEADWLSGFPAPLSEGNFEDLYHFYNDMVFAGPDAETGLTILRVNAFRPEDAQRLNAGLLDLSEQLVNRLNERINSKAITEAEERVRLAEQRVRNARVELAAFRNQSDLLNPEQQGMAVLSVSSNLITQEAAMRAKLAEVQAATPNHPSLPAMRKRVAALAQQVAEQTGRAVGTPGGIASKLGGYETLLVEQEFATQMLTGAQASLEQARAEAVSQQYYLERVVEPNRPDDALLPARMKSILAVLFASLCLYLVGWMLVVGILEHAPDD
ncbi:capsule biosynthesis protein [Croceicoccus marinus]|uniref:Capsule biosynthesis protein n=1 Tax=Croceicoccus marinus TaxID=450378 RepID=A0A7G6VVX5_9SPHN|nr:capsule biosynthesis protein [Croceicoccus marinus]QNE05890.1 capsule biosynthesis protein [Croceicoccus marinus]